MDENPIAPAADAGAAPSPESSRPDLGPTLTCRMCRTASPAGTPRCPSCNGSLRTPAAAALAALAAVAGLAAVAWYGNEIVTSEGNTLRPAFHAVAGLLSLLAAWSIYQGRRSGWLGIQLLWLAQIAVPVVYAALLHKGVVQSLVRDPADFLIVKLPLLVGIPLAWIPASRRFCAAPSALMTIFRREFGAFFFSPLAYIIMTAFLLFVGFIFYNTLVKSRDFLIDEGLQHLFGLTRWILMMICAPALTMRLLAEEKKSGTIELMMTAPVTDFQIVLAKFLAVLAFFCVLVSPTLIYVVMMVYCSLATPDYGVIVGGYLGVVFMAAASLAIGVFISSVTRSQVVAAIVSFIVLLSFWIIPYFMQRADADWARKVGGFLDFMQYHEIFTKGIIDSRAVVFDLSVAALFLFLSVRALESRRWA